MLTIQSGTVNAIGNATGDLAPTIYGVKGIVISGTATVTATATGANADGLYTPKDITVSTNGTVTAKGTGTRYALFADKDINISNGTVVLSNSDTPSNLYYGALNHTGGTLNGNAPDGAPVTNEITGFAAIADVNAGTAGSSIYANAAAVIAALPNSVTANHSGGTVSWPVTTWMDIDSYNPAAAGSYTFTAVLVAPAPPGFANSDGHKATVEVVVNAPTGGKLADALKAELEKTTPATINVTEDITLSEAVRLGASHTLTIQSGKTLTFGDVSSGQATLTVPYGETLTVNGDGTLEVSNSTTSWGVLVMGNMTASGGKLTVKNSGENTTGIWAYGQLSIENGSFLTVQNTDKTIGILGNITIQNSLQLFPVQTLHRRNALVLLLTL